MPEATHAVLDRRSLASDHRRLNELLRPGLRVLDVGCGTGAITRGAAAAVGAGGLAVGADVSATLLGRARAAHAAQARLAFVVADAYALPFRRAVDVVTAARMLQWLARPLDALRAMSEAAAPGGAVLVLDFNHERAAWEPRPPESFRRFYAAFLGWRAGAGMDNAIADRLESLFARAGLARVTVTAQDETARRGEPDFEARAGIWADVAASRGHQMVADGAVTEAERSAAEADYRAWVGAEAREHVQYLRAAAGRVC
ncbi:MAG: methyltransferase domain-containing protein [Candidatus Rokubacteria bacterium]|nr:methyltransferase domain-containing protein [Candidatus Rokubacteria bacterium]